MSVAFRKALPLLFFWSYNLSAVSQLIDTISYLRNCHLQCIPLALQFLCNRQMLNNHGRSEFISGVVFSAYTFFSLIFNRTAAVGTSIRSVGEFPAALSALYHCHIFNPFNFYCSENYISDSLILICFRLKVKTFTLKVYNLIIKT